MKMIFFSPERAEVELVRNELTEAGIACEIHDQNGAEMIPGARLDPELWLQHDEDASRAILLCVELGIGFAKRAREKQGETEEEDLAA